MVVVVHWRDRGRRRSAAQPGARKHAMLCCAVGVTAAAVCVAVVAPPMC